MGEYDSSVALALRLIKQKGELIKWRQLLDNPPLNIEQPWKATNALSHTEFSASIVFLPNKRAGHESQTYELKTEVPTAAYYGLMGQVSFVPSLKDVVIRDGKELRIFAIDALSPNGQIVLYTVRFYA